MTETELLKSLLLERQSGMPRWDTKRTSSEPSRRPVPADSELVDRVADNVGDME